MREFSGLVYATEDDTPETVTRIIIGSCLPVQEATLIMNNRHRYTNLLYGVLGVMSTDARELFIQQVNKEIVKFHIEPYEQHWVDFLKNGLELNPEIIKYDTGLSAVNTLVYDIKGLEPDMVKMSNSNGTSYLKISKISRFSSGDQGRVRFILGDGILNTLRKIFVESYEDRENIFVKYGPASDMSIAYLLTRILHSWF